MGCHDCLINDLVYISFHDFDDVYFEPLMLLYLVHLLMFLLLFLVPRYYGTNCAIY